MVTQGLKLFWRLFFMDAFSTAVLVSVTELLLVSLPQNLANIICLYAFNKKKIDVKNFWIAMLISLVAIFSIRQLPIGFGIPSLLSMVALIILGVYFLKFPIRRTILAVFFNAIVTLLLEIVTMKVITLIYGVDGFNKILDNDLTYAFSGCPESIVLVVVSFVVYYLFTRHIKRSSDDGETCEAIS